MAPKHRLYTPEIAEEILERTEDGESLTSICRREGMPSRGAVRQWIETDHDGFAARFACARARGVEHLADEILSISDDGSNDTYEDEDGVEHVKSDVVQRSRLRVDSRKWLLSKLLPKQYGDRLELGGELELKGTPDDGIQSRIAILLGTAGIVGALGGNGPAEENAPDPDLLSGPGTSET